MEPEYLPMKTPQIFLGAISFINHPDPIPMTPVPTIFKNHPTEQNNAYINSLPLSLDPLAIDSSTMPASRRRSTLRGINHSLLTRISPTNYLLRDLNYPVHTTVHVRQITDYVWFDERLRAYGDSTDFHSIPFGYMDFCTAWNNGTADNDHRRFSTIYRPEI